MVRESNSHDQDHDYCEDKQNKTAADNLFSQLVGRRFLQSIRRSQRRRNYVVNESLMLPSINEDMYRSTCRKEQMRRAWNNSLSEETLMQQEELRKQSNILLQKIYDAPDIASNDDDDDDDDDNDDDDDDDEGEKITTRDGLSLETSNAEDIKLYGPKKDRKNDAKSKRKLLRKLSSFKKTESSSNPDIDLGKTMLPPITSPNIQDEKTDNMPSRTRRLLRKLSSFSLLGNGNEAKIIASGDKKMLNLCLNEQANSGMVQKSRCLGDVREVDVSRLENAEQELGIPKSSVVRRYHKPITLQDTNQIWEQCNIIDILDEQERLENLENERRRKNACFTVSGIGR